MACQTRKTQSAGKKAVSDRYFRWFACDVLHNVCYTPQNEAQKIYDRLTADHASANRYPGLPYYSFPHLKKTDINQSFFLTCFLVPSGY